MTILQNKKMPVIIKSSFFKKGNSREMRLEDGNIYLVHDYCQILVLE